MQYLYRKWIEFVFERPETPNGWYFDLEIEPFEAEASPQLIIELVTQTFLQAEKDLGRFSNSQVAAGLNYVFNNSCSNLVFELKAQSLPLANRLKFLESIESLYQHCYRKRCVEALGHRNEGISDPLNLSCYMLWDVTPLMYWEDDPQRKALYSGVVLLLERCLNIPHEACIESALHGLGHVHSYAPEEVEEAIDGWLRRSSQHRNELIQYAKAARVGNVQ
jgi:hypothetical protein